jgi:hypothetical protein
LFCNIHSEETAIIIWNNGMSWSKPGSLALASITVLDRNKEADKWFSKGLIGFKLAA